MTRVGSTRPGLRERRQSPGWDCEPLPDVQWGELGCHKQGSAGFLLALQLEKRSKGRTGLGRGKQQPGSAELRSSAGRVKTTFLIQTLPPRIPWAPPRPRGERSRPLAQVLVPLGIRLDSPLSQRY